VEAYFAKAGVVGDSWVTSSFGYGPAMKKDFPEIKDFVRINNYDCERMVRYKNVIHREPRVVFADSNFFAFFNYKLVTGGVNTVLKEPNSIVLSTSAAKKYFGNDNPIGKFLDVTTLLSAYHCVVTGVFEDFPMQSHIHLDMMMSYSTAPKWQRETWYMHEAYTYVKVNNKADAASVEQKFPQLAEKYKSEPAAKDKLWGVYLTQLKSIHLNPFKPYEREAKGSRKTIGFISVIAWIILIVGWVNFINTLIPKAMERAGEISVRRITGASDKHIFMHFLVESAVVNVLALGLFFLFLLAFMPLFENLSAETLFWHFWQRAFVWQLIGFTFFCGVVITSIIPFLVLKGVDTGAVLKNKLAFSSGFGKAPRMALIIFQFFAAMVLIITTATVHKQLNYMRTVDLGIGVDQTLVFRTPTQTDDYAPKLDALMQTIKGFTGVHAVTASSTVPGRSEAFVMSNERDDDPLKTTRLCDMIRVDYDFVPAYQLSLIKGRNFSRSYPADKETSVILTENAMQLFGFKNADDAVNGAVNFEGQGNKKFPVVGVVKDFHQLSLREGYRPIILMMNSPWNAINMEFISVKINGASAPGIVAATEKQFKAIFPASSYDSFFLDDYFNSQYRDDIKYGFIITAFTWIALIIVCLGIFGLSSFMLIKRSKEIAIRKITGAGVLQILRLLNMDFILCILAAFVLAMPVAWFAMQQWLQNFTYRTTVGWWVFLLSGVITLVITVLTVSTLAFKTAVSNPVKSLRNE
jgi:putative ABC transport system permease protein